MFKGKQPVAVIKEIFLCSLAPARYLVIISLLLHISLYALFALDFPCLLPHSISKPPFIVICFISLDPNFWQQIAIGECLILPGLDSNLSYQD